MFCGHGTVSCQQKQHSTESGTNRQHNKINMLTVSTFHADSGIVCQVAKTDHTLQLPEKLTILQLPEKLPKFSKSAEF